MHVISDFDVLQMNAGLDDAAVADPRRTLQGDVGIDDRIRADRDCRIDDHRRWIAKRDALAHQALDDAALYFRLDICQLRTRVHAKDFNGIVDHYGADAPAAFAQHPDQIG